MAITDLTNTKWLLNDSIYITQEISYNINCSYDGYDFGTIDFRYYTADITIWEDNKIWKGLLLNEDYAIAEITAQENPIKVINGDRILEITGGTDATNSTLISWLEANATQIVEPEPSSDNKISFGNLNIKSMSLGNLPISSMYLGDIKIYEEGSGPTPPTPTLENPSIIQVGQKMSISNIDNAEYCDIYVDNVLSDTVAVEEV